MAGAPDAYQAVLEDVATDLKKLRLRMAEKKTQIEEKETQTEQLREDLKSMEKEHARLEGVAAYAHSKQAAKGEVPEPAKATTTRTVPDFAEEALKKAGRWLDTQQLIQAMEACGYQTSAGNKYTTVFGSLRRTVKKDRAILRKVGNKWGLAGWPHPNVALMPIGDWTAEDPEEEEETSA